jgi:hypothetical protein
MWKQEQNAGTADKGYADFDVVITLPEEGAATGREVHIKSKIAEYVYQIRNREAEKDNQDDK